MFIIRVLNSYYSGGSRVAKVGSSSSSVDSSLVSYIPLYSFIFERTIEGSYGIRLAFRNAALYKSEVKVFLENLSKIVKKSAFVISVAL